VNVKKKYFCTSLIIDIQYFLEIFIFFEQLSNLKIDKIIQYSIYIYWI